MFSEIWSACVGPLVMVPKVRDKVFYFPQGHIEQVSSSCPIWVGFFRRLLPVIFLYRIPFLCFPILLQVSVCFFCDQYMVSVALTCFLLFLCGLSCGRNEFVFR